MPRGRRSTLLLSVATLALPVALGACSTLGIESDVALTIPAPDGGASEPVQEAAEVDADRLIRIGAATEAVGDLENAITMYQRALSLAPDSAEALLALAGAYRKAGAPENAAKAYRRVLERDPDSLAARRGLGNTLVALGRPDEALVEFDLLVAAEPLDERGHNGRGVALSLLGRHEEARLAYESGLKLAPADLELNNNLATLLLMTGEPEQALSILRRIAKYPGAPERVRQNLARAEKAVTERSVHVSELAPPTETPLRGEEAGILYQAPEQDGAEAATLSDVADVTPSSPPDAAGPSAAEDSADRPIDEAADEAELPDTAGLAPSAGQDAKAERPVSTGAIAGYRIQLSAEASRELALERWAELSKEASDLLGEFSPHISQAPDTGNGAMYRLRMSPRLSQAEAKALCDALNGRSIPCYVSTVFESPKPDVAPPATVEGATPVKIMPAQTEDSSTPAPWQAL